MDNIFDDTRTAVAVQGRAELALFTVDNGRTRSC